MELGIICNFLEFFFSLSKKNTKIKTVIDSDTSIYTHNLANAFDIYNNFNQLSGCYVYQPVSLPSRVEYYQCSVTSQFDDV